MDVKVNCESRAGYTLEVLCTRGDGAVPVQRLIEAMTILEATEGIGPAYYTDSERWLDAVIAVFKETPLYTMFRGRPMRLGVPYRGAVIAIDVTDHG